MSTFIVETQKNFEPDPNENLFKSLFSQYERVIVESLISSFGLDAILFPSGELPWSGDQHGGDVDTILNVRKVGTDPDMKYKNKNNESDFRNLGKYNPKDYHNVPGSNYQQIKHDARAHARETGKGIRDEYTGDQIFFMGRSKNASANKNAHLDHVLSASSTHNDPGRVLSGLSGKDLADSSENLAFTNASLNCSMGAMDIPDYIALHPELPDQTKTNMMRKYNAAKKSYEAKIAKAYYTSPKFAKDLTVAAGKDGVKMGLRQALGFVFAEVWFGIKDEFALVSKSSEELDMQKFFLCVASGIKKGFENAREKYKELLKKFEKGTLSGIIASITTTLCNIFFTTARNTVKIIRQSYASIVEAAEILFINPECYPFGERMRAVAKVISMGASVVLGSVVTDAIQKTPVGAIPVIGDIVSTFCGALCSGVLSCTLLVFMDKSKTINRLVHSLNQLYTVENEIYYYRQQVAFFEKYAAELLEIDVETFRKEIISYRQVVNSISSCQSDQELNTVLKNQLRSLGISLSWDEYDDFNSFMQDKNAVMVFE